jgi:hypothetical protein
LGLRFADVEAEGLESEPVVQDKVPGAVRRRLAINGATAAEIAFLLNRERVELNAMASDLVAFIVRKLMAAGARKVVPATATLAAAYGAFKREQKLEEAIEAALKELWAEPKIETPPDIEARVKQYLTEYPADTWNRAVRQIAEEE